MFLEDLDEGEPAEVGNVRHILAFVKQVIAPSISRISKSL